MPDIIGLLAQLDALDLACREGRWDEAERLYADYDAAVRRVPPADWNADDLARLARRQQALETQMRADRDSAAGELGQFGAHRRGAQAYRS